MPNSTIPYPDTGRYTPRSITPRFTPIRRDCEPSDGTPVVIGFGGPVSNELPPNAAESLLREYTWIVDQVINRIPAALIASANLEPEDLRQEGLIALLSAAQTFDRMRSARFSPYARTVVTNAVFGALRAHDPLAETVRRDLREMARYINEHVTRFHEPPSEEELAAGTGISRARVRAIRRQAALVLAIQRGDDEDADGADPTASLVHEAIEDACAKQELENALKLLEERDRRIVFARTVEGRTVREVAEAEAISIGRVSQIHTRAIARLRAALLSACTGIFIWGSALGRDVEVVTEHFL